MQPKQKQWQLYFLGHYGDSLRDIDGCFGPASRKATLALQREVFSDAREWDGLFGEKTAEKSRQLIADIQRRLGCSPADGLAGPQTMAALEQWQQARGLPVTGRADPETRRQLPEEPAEADWWKDIRHFTRQELRCKCGGRYCDGFPAEPREAAVRLADRARDHFGRPARNVSFLRCPTWNRLQGGVSGSHHLTGGAMDIRIDGISADRLLAYFQQQPEVRYCYKINGTNVHFDIGPERR